MMRSLRPGVLRRKTARNRKKDENMDMKKDGLLMPPDGCIYLRPMTEADTENIVAWRNKDRVRRNFIYQKPFTKEGHLNWLHTQVEPGHAVQFVICEKDAARPVGSVYLRDIDRKMRHAEYGIFIGEDDAVGKGYGTRAAGLILAFAFEELGLEKVFLRVFEDNAGARKSYEKAGFLLNRDRREEVTTGEGRRTVVFYETESR